MDSDSIHYLSGEEVHAGDRVQYRGSYATVVVVSTGEDQELSPGYEDHSGCDRGIMLCDDDGVTALIREADEHLAFLDRG